MTIVTAKQALQAAKRNNLRSWHTGPSSSERSDNPNDAANRIYTGYADIDPRYTGPKFSLRDPVFTMGSCFAREIEWALKQKGGNVISIDDTIQIPEFADANGKVTSSFFHRYTPTSMVQEFQWPFGLVSGWNDDALIFETSEGVFHDVNYTPAFKRDRSSVGVRRRIAGELIRQAAKARIIILTLGLTESWQHVPTGFAVNAPDASVLVKRSDEFALNHIGYEDTLAAVESILALLKHVHDDGDFQLFLTVSPVPFQRTFSDEDVIIANMTSKSTLRAAARSSAKRHEQIHYFPSYELVNYSEQSLAWRPDRVHVDPGMVKHIMGKFISSVFDDIDD